MIGATPMLDVLGVYFPGWLVSSTAGLVFSYVLVRALGRSASTRALGQSGLFFCSLTLASALTVWWACFSRF